jgi:hypothetical protein
MRTNDDDMMNDENIVNTTVETTKPEESVDKPITPKGR